jgi:assimilatory nitrate reductase catalytic subunit
MSLFEWLRHKSGIDTRAARYAYGEDPVLGFTSARKHAERWVNSTCGYCSVVSVRGNPDHPVNRGKLCP